MTSEQNYAGTTLIRAALDVGALGLGKYKLRSGRPSAYFVNMGTLSKASDAIELAKGYVEIIKESGIVPATIFGAAYKGIPLAVLVATELAKVDSKYQHVGFAYNRKEEKEHGEGGEFIGKLISPLIVLDDVLSAGTAAVKAMEMLAKVPIKPEALIVGFDRMERLEGEEGNKRTALYSLRDKYDIQTYSLANAKDLVDVLIEDGKLEHAQEVKNQLAEYGTIS